MPNRIHPKKLVGSKWTAAVPVDRELHFLVLGYADFDEPRPQILKVEAVLTGAIYRVPWRQLKDDSRWLMGWRRPPEVEGD